jgi:hypothetical protein
VAIGAGLVALLTGWSSLAGLLPLVIVLRCPLMLLVMMGGMHHRDDSTGHRPGGGGHDSSSDQPVRRGRRID